MEGDSHVARLPRCVFVLVALAMSMACALHAQTIATNCLRINADGSVSIPHFAPFNAYPLTVSAWVRTTNITGTIEPLVSKYLNGSLNGWSVHMLSGRVRAFYYRNGSDFINPTGTGPGMDGGPIA